MGNSSKGPQATRRSRAWNGLAPASLPVPRGAGPPGSGSADASCPVRCSERGGSSRVQSRSRPAAPAAETRSRLGSLSAGGDDPRGRRKAFGPRFPRTRRPAPRLAPHASLLAETRAPDAAGRRDQARATPLGLRGADKLSHLCPEERAALGGERRRGAVAWEEQVLRESRAGPGLVRSGSRAEPELVAAGPGGGCAL